MKQERMFFVDNLRLMVIVLVVILHVAVTYSGLGGWYYKEGRPLGEGALLFFAVFQCFLQAFFMGTLFMVAGYFAAASLKSKGTREFLKGRMIRLGIPTLFYMLVINPGTVYFLKDWDHTLYPVTFSDFYFRYITGLHFIGGTGPMWFALALLIFCVVYALALTVTGAQDTSDTSGIGASERPFPVLLPFLLVLAVSALAFLLRLEWPIGSNVSNMQLGYFSQYIILFCFGIVAHGRGWFATIEYSHAKKCLLAAFSGIPLLLGFIVFMRVFEDNESFRGGMNWQSLAFAVWESFTGVFMSVGLVGVLREKWNTQGDFAKSMSASAFAVYVFHPPLLVFLSQVLRPLEIGAIPKFLLVSAVAVPLSFAVARIIRATPLLRAMVRS
jgi:surface polysaccharide O-acyltransferase-like enzyme